MKFRYLVIGFIITAALYTFIKFTEAVFFDDYITAIVIGSILTVQISTIIPLLKRTE